MCFFAVKVFFFFFRRFFDILMDLFVSSCFNHCLDSSCWLLSLITIFANHVSDDKMVVCNNQAFFFTVFYFCSAVFYLRRRILVLRAVVGVVYDR